MKKISYLILFLLSSICVEAQIINFNDINFKNKLLEANTSNYIASFDSSNYDVAGNGWNFPSNGTAIDINGDGEIEVSEAQMVKCLNLSYASLSDISEISYFTNLEYLDVNSNTLTAIQVDQNLNLSYLSCSENSITSLNLNQNTNLQYLNCDSNPIGLLDVSQNTQLKTLSCYNCQLTTINLTANSSLIYLDVNTNLLTSINVDNLSSLKTFYCGTNQLTALNTANNLLIENFAYANSQLPNLNLSHLLNLIYLNCQNTNTTTLNLSSFINLIDLNCSQNLLVNLDLSDNVNLKNINCLQNQLTTITLPNTSNEIESLNCANNDLNSINLTKIKWANCSDNPLLNLNLANPTYLRKLYCTNTNLTALDLSGTGYLQILNIDHNQQLNSIILKNGYNNTFNDSPGILNQFTFNNCPNLNFVCIDSEFTGMSSESSYIQAKINSYGYQNQVNVNSYCSFAPGGQYYTVQGQVKYDNNNDGCDVSDPIYRNLALNITNGTNNGSFITNAGGNYSIPVQAGQYTITPVIENSTYFTVSPNNIVVDFPTQASPFTQNFCVTANGTHPDLEITLLPITSARPGFDANYKLVYKNKGTNTQSGTLNLSFDDAVLDFVSATPAIATQTINNISWNFTNLQSFETREITFTMNVNSPMETPAVNIGDILNYTATISSVDTDETPLDNTFTLNQTVVNSFDPNDKTCLEGATITPSEVGNYVHYIIRFENTGTFPAENIVVKDMIDTNKFHIASLVPINGSHDFYTRINGNNVEFIFENINLPFDDANNDGYVAFKIKTLPTLTNGDTFSNSASIYFDYNFPVVTNTATTNIQLLSTQDFEFGNYFALYPNPVNNVLNIETKQTVEVSSISIYNTLGQLVLVIPNAQQVKSVDVSSLTSGNYFVKVYSDKGTSNTKFIKK